MILEMTNKRKSILKLIDRFGVISTNQIKNITGIYPTTIYKALASFEENNLIKKANIATRENIYMITQIGSGLCGTINLGFSPNQKTPNMSILRHTLMVNNTISYYIKMFKKEKNENLKIFTERELLVQELGKGKRSKKVVDTLPDFVFERSSGRKTAVEVELTRKRPDRLQKKLRAYKEQIQQGIYFNVAYCYDDLAVYRLVKRYADKVGLQVILDKLDEEIEV